MNTIRERLLHLLGLEPLVVLTTLGIGAFFFYKIFLRKLNSDRHKNLRNLFKKLLFSYLSFLAAWLFQYRVIFQLHWMDDYYPYFGVIAVALGSLVFIRIVKIVVFEYLFFTSKAVGVPVLLVDIFTLMVSLFLAAWFSTSVFGVRWAPLLATSAILSVVLGLALQDTLGNLFAGVALQFDKPYEIGDWIEIKTGGETFTGEVHEITWRATTLYGFFDEVVTLPNRLAAQSEISNFSARKKPIYRGLSIYVDAEANEEQVKEVFRNVLKETPGVLQDLEALVMLRDLTEKGAMYRLFYPITHFSKQFVIVDQILMRTQTEFKKRGIATARFRVETVEKNA